MPDPLCRNFVLERECIYNKVNSLVLDIGCGTGFFTSKFKKVVGLDVSRNNLLTAKQLLPEKDFVLADATFLPFKQNSFDGSISMEVLEHISDPVETINEIHRCLVKGGMYLLSVDVFSPSRPFSRFITEKFVVTKELWHKKTILSDKNDETVIDRSKLIFHLEKFNILWEKKFRGLAVNLLTVLAIVLDKITRPKFLKKEDMGSQILRVNSILIRIYIRIVETLIKEVTKLDPFRWDASCVMVLAQKK